MLEPCVFEQAASSRNAKSLENNESFKQAVILEGIKGNTQDRSFRPLTDSDFSSTQTHAQTKRLPT